MSIKRNTVQKQIVLDAIKNLNKHSSIDDVYAEINNEHPSISKSTVYRNLRQLAEHRIIRQVSFPDGLERYDCNASPHYHFRCRHCGSIFDVDIGYLSGIDDSVRVKYGFIVDEHDVVFSGICKTCKSL